MKKLVVLILVFGVASMASAGFQISVNGDPEPVDTEIILLPSETLELDIWTDADIPFMADQLWMCVVDTTAATITGGRSLIEGSPVHGPAPSSHVIPPAGMAGMWGNVINLNMTPIAAGTVVVDSLIIHAEGCCCDAVVQLWEVIEDVGTAGVLFDQVIIHVPEPASMILFGLGAAVLLIKRRA